MSHTPTTTAGLRTMSLVKPPEAMRPEVTSKVKAGSAATGVTISEWLGGFSVFFFLSLAFVKRFSELESLRERDLAR